MHDIGAPPGRRIRIKGGGCLAEIIFPIIFVALLAIVLFTVTDTPFPTPKFLQAPPALASGQQAGSLAAYTSGVQRWDKKILEWEKRYDVDRHIIATIMQIETCGNANAVGGSGEQGLFQVMPIHFNAGETAMLDPDVNAAAALGFFKRMHAYTGYDVYRTFAGYNGGYAAADMTFSYWPSHTQTYYTLAKGIYDDVKAGLYPSPTIENAVSGKRCPP